MDCNSIHGEYHINNWIDILFLRYNQIFNTYCIPIPIVYSYSNHLGKEVETQTDNVDTNSEKQMLVEMSTQTEFASDIVELAYSTIADYVRSKDLDADVKAMMSRHLQEAQALSGKKNSAKNNKL